MERVEKFREKEEQKKNLLGLMWVMQERLLDF